MLPAVKADRGVDVVTLGENSLDVVAVVGGEPPSSGKHALDDLRLEPGGQMATAALGCARLGLRTRYIGVFGDDPWSRRAREPLEAAGVELVAIERRGVSGRAAVIVVAADGERTVFERRAPGLVLTAADIDPASLADAGVLLVDGTQPDASLRAVGIARGAGVVVISDIDRRSPEADALLAEVDVAIVPEAFVCERWGSLSDGLLRLAHLCRRASAVVATRGAAGSLAWFDGSFVETPGCAVQVLDTTGAGDAFRAGFAAALIRSGPIVDLGDLLRFANATAALNCTGVGAQRGLPDLEAVHALIAAVTPPPP